MLVDETTRELCWELIKDDFCLKRGSSDYDWGRQIAIRRSIPWLLCGRPYSREGLRGHSLLINLGGGMVTDLGGFAASTFKRGINFINIPTTLLAMVDASVGGKTGVNFGGLKNEIGVFNEANTVILNTDWLRHSTLLTSAVAMPRC